MATNPSPGKKNKRTLDSMISGRALLRSTQTHTSPPSPPSFPPLPTELWHNIIDKVAEDDPGGLTLRRCADVNKTFRERSLHHIFRRLRFSDQAKTLRMLEQDEHIGSEHERRGRIGIGIDFCEWCQHIKCLYSEPRASPFRHTYTIDYGDDTRDHQLHDNHEQYLSYFTNVSRLNLNGTNIRRMPKFAALGSTVLRLSMISCEIDVDGFLTLLRSFTQLQHLEVMTPKFTSSVAEFAAEGRAQGHLPPLLSVSLVAYTIGIFGNYDEGTKLENYLSLSGETLTTINLSSWGQGERVFDLSKMVNLAEVRISETKATRSRCIKILKTLLSLEKLELEVLHLDFIGSVDSKESDPVWQQLDDTLVALHRKMGNNPLRFKTNLHSPGTLFNNFFKCVGIIKDSKPFPDPLR